MSYRKKSINLKFMLLSSTLMFAFPVHAQFGPGGTTLSTPYTNNTTVVSEGFLTMSGNGAVFTNSSGATFNNANFTTTMQNKGSFNNSGTADLGTVSILSEGGLTNNANATLTTGATTIAGKNSSLTNAGTATLSSLNSSNAFPYVVKINNNTGGHMSVTGNTTLGYTNLNNMGTLNLGTLNANEFATIVTYTGSTTKVTGEANFSDPDTSMANNGITSFDDNLSVIKGASITNNPNGNFSVTGNSFFDQGSFTNQGTANLAAFTVQNDSTVSIYNGAITNVSGAANITGTHTLMVSSGMNNFNSTFLLGNGARLFNYATGELNVSGAATIDKATLTNNGKVHLTDLTVQNSGILSNTTGANLTSTGTITFTGSGSTMTNAGTANLTHFNVNDNANVTNSGSLSATGTTTVDNATLTNADMASLTDLTIQNGGTINQSTAGSNLTVSGNTLIMGNGSSLTNAGLGNFNSLNLLAGGTLTNNNQVNVSGDTIIDNSSYINASGTSTFVELSIQNAGMIINNNWATINVGDTIVTGATAAFSNAGMANLFALAVQNHGTFTNESTANLNITGTASVNESIFTNDGDAEINTIYVQNNGTLTNNNNLNITDTALVTNGILTNKDAATINTLLIQNGGTMNNAAGTLTANTAYSYGENSKLVNSADVTINNLYIQASGHLNNNNTGNLTATTTTMDTQGILNNDGIAHMGALTMTSQSSLNNTGGTFTADITHLTQATINNAANMNLGETTFVSGSLLSNTAGAINIASLTTDTSNLYNNAEANLGNTTVNNNSLFTNDIDGKLTITGDLKNSNSQILNKGNDFTVTGLSLVTNSTINNYGIVNLGTATLTGSIFNSYSNSELNSGNFELNNSNFNMTSSTFNSTGSINIGAGSLYTVDSGLGHNSSSFITATNGLNVLGELTGSADINGDVIVGRGGVLSLLSTDYININGNLTFEPGSTYYTTINVRDPHDVSDQNSLINTNGHTYDNGMTISVGANVRPYETGKKYAILVTDNLSETSQTLTLRNSILTGYVADWEQTDTNEYTLFVEIKTRPIQNISDLTYNEKQVSELIATLTPDTDISSDLNDTLDYLYTQVNDQKTLTKTLRGFSMETTANYLNYMPTLNRMMSQGAESRLNQDYQTQLANHLWVTPFASKSKQNRSQDILNLDVQGFDADIYGLSAGVDKYFGDYLLGAMVSYGNIDFKGDYTQDKITADAAQVGLYAARKFGSWFTNSKASYTHLWNNGTSVYSLLPTNDTTKGKFETDVYAFNIKGGYEFKLGRYNLSPSVGVDVVHAKQDAFTESGADGLSRQVDKANLTSVELPVKLQLDWINTFNNGINLKPKFYVEYAREVGDDMVTIDSQFIGALGRKTSANSMYNNRNRYTVGTEIGLDLGATWNLALKYNADFRKDYTNNSVMTSFEYNF